YLKNTGRVEFNHQETPDLKTLFAKLGGLIVGPELYYVSDKVFIMRDNTIVAQYDAQKIFMGAENAVLQDNDFVYVTVKEPNQVYVFGKGVPNGLVKFTQAEEFDLRTLVGKIGGIKEGISRKITIVTEKSVETFVWDEYANRALTNNSIILFDVDRENYVYLIKADGTPDMVYIDQNTTLYEVLMKAGVDKNYRKIELTRGIEKYSLELKDLAQARSYVVKAGDVVKILDVPQNFAYVLGEVNKPGIIKLTEGTTVLQAIIQSGYFTNKAAASSVWLYKGGIDGKPIRVNLAGAIGGGRIEYDPILENGDIVFVPSDIFKTALEWIPVINNLIVFYNNISELFK
ncbi:MAG: SLBB domain-containing protein, partial [Pseudothermotoga sp.]|uniref:polysaccharide biosynthesis/export family protein n=1 Tax=Pseudothermotoga sp. TaxID=2033661 RepID=UPI0025894949